MQKTKIHKVRLTEKQGEDIIGCEIVTNINLQIK